MRLQSIMRQYTQMEKILQREERDSQKPQETMLYGKPMLNNTIYVHTCYKLRFDNVFPCTQLGVVWQLEAYRFMHTHMFLLGLILDNGCGCYSLTLLRILSQTCPMKLRSGLFDGQFERLRFISIKYSQTIGAARGLALSFISMNPSQM